MAKDTEVFIFTDENDAVEHGSESFGDYLSQLYEDRIFIISEDNKNLFETEEGTSFIIQEYFE